MSSKILVAIDGSDHAWKALEVACDLAKAHGGDLLVLHAVDRPVRSETLRLLATQPARREAPPGWLCIPRCSTPSGEIDIDASDHQPRRAAASGGLRRYGPFSSAQARLSPPSGARQKRVRGPVRREGRSRNPSRA